MEESKIKEVLQLIEQWTRSEIMARHAYLNNSDFVDYVGIKIEKEDEIRKLLFGTSDLIQLGLRWQILKPANKPSKEDLKQQYGRLQKELVVMLRES